VFLHLLSEMGGRDEDDDPRSLGKRLFSASRRSVQGAVDQGQRSDNYRQCPAFASGFDPRSSEGEDPLAPSHIISQEHVLSPKHAKQERPLSRSRSFDMGIMLPQSVHDQIRDTDSLDLDQLVRAAKRRRRRLTVQAVPSTAGYSGKDSILALTVSVMLVRRGSDRGSSDPLDGG